MIKAVLFDLDGVLVDAVRWHYLALNRALSHFGYKIEEEEHSTLFNGLPTSVKLEILTQRRNFPKALHGFTNELKQAYTRQILNSSCHPNPEITKLLSVLESRGMLIGLASNSQRATIDVVLKRMGITDFFDVIVSQEEVAHPKPAPDIYRRCFEKLGTNPESCLIVEDSLPGIQAARSACPNVLIVKGPEEVTLSRISQTLAAKERVANPAPVVARDLEIVIPMAGMGQRFADAGYADPKPLINVSGKPMIHWVIENVQPKNTRCHFTFLCNEIHLRQLDTEQTLRKLVPQCSVVSVPGLTEGAACTLLLGIDNIDPEKPLLIANSDQFVDIGIDEFLRHAKHTQVDGLIMTFPASETKWSYASINDDGRVTKVAEKDPISNHATVGIYYFKRGKNFIEAAMRMIRKNIRTNNEFYVCPVYNELVAMGKNIQIFEIAASKMHGLGTPEDLHTFLRRSAV